MASEIQSTDYGPMAGYFECARLGSLCVEDAGVQTGPFGSQLHQEDYVTAGTPIITVEHLGDNRITHTNLPRVSEDDRLRLSRYSLQDGDIVFSRVGSVDRRALVRREEDGWLFSGRCLRVRVNKERIYPQFLSLFFGLEGFKEHIRRVAVGATMPSINTKILSDIPIYFPPLAEQRAITAVLGALDDKIELNRRMNATLEAMARALFQSWFVDFVPVRAKLDERQPVGLDPGTASLFPAFFQETKVGYIPAGWQLGRLADLCNLKRGHDLPTSTRTAGPIPVISSSGISGTHSETNVLGPGVVTGRYGTIGKVFYIETDYWPLNTTLFVDDFKGNPPRFIFHALGEVNFQNYTDKAAVPGVNRNHLHEEPTVFPPMELRQAFAHSVSPLWSQHAANERESRTLAILRDTLLPKLLSGELVLPQMATSD